MITTLQNLETLSRIEKGEKTEKKVGRKRERKIVDKRVRELSLSLEGERESFSL